MLLLRWTCSSMFTNYWLSLTLQLVSPHCIDMLYIEASARGQGDRGGPRGEERERREGSSYKSSVFTVHTKHLGSSGVVLCVWGWLAAKCSSSQRKTDRQTDRHSHSTSPPLCLNDWRVPGQTDRQTQPLYLPSSLPEWLKGPRAAIQYEAGRQQNAPPLSQTDRQTDRHSTSLAIARMI